jgi:hypothetical protein
MRSAACLLCALAGCSGSHDPPSRPATPAISGLTSIAIQPGMQTLVMDGVTPATADYHALGTFADGHSEDVTARVSFSVQDPGIGFFDNAHFTSGIDHGGITNVLAQAGQVTATAPLYLMIRWRVNDSSSQFAGPPTGAVPSLVYPADGVLVPPNLRGLEVHFRPGAGNTLFEIAFSNAITDVRVYGACTPLGDGCLYTVADDVWRWLERTNAGVAPIAIAVRGSDGNSVGASGSVSLQISRDPLLGAIYYWTTSGGTAIMRYDFASTGDTAEKFVGPEMAGGNCIGCHALSRDGTRMVAEAGGQNDGRLLLLDVAKDSPMVPFGSTAKSTFESWSPNGDVFVGVYGDAGATDWNLLLLDGATGAKRGNLPGTGTAQNPADHPDWSPDGNSIAYVKVGQPNTLQRMSMGAIEMVAASGGAPIEIVPALAGKNRYYPAFAPDSQFLVFDESTCPPGTVSSDTCDADTDPSATLFAVAARAGATPIRLDRANGGDGLTNSFPKWSPFVFKRTGEAASRLMWLTYSSSRAMGLRPPPPSPNGQNPTGTLIWMAAIDPDQIANGLDGSYAAFALPVQDLMMSNHIAQWTQQIIPPIQ